MLQQAIEAGMALNDDIHTRDAGKSRLQVGETVLLRFCYPGLIDERDNYRSQGEVDQIGYRWTWRASGKVGS